MGTLPIGPCAHACGRVRKNHRRDDEQTAEGARAADEAFRNPRIHSRLANAEGTNERGGIKQVAAATEITVEPGDVLLGCDRARCQGGADDRVYVESNGVDAGVAPSSRWNSGRS